MAMTEPPPDYTGTTVDGRSYTTVTYPDADIVPAQAKQLEAWMRPYLLTEYRRVCAKKKDLERLLGMKGKEARR